MPWNPEPPQRQQPATPLRNPYRSMKAREIKDAMECAISAAEKAGDLMRRNRLSKKVVHAAVRYDIKLELDVRCQTLIEKTLAGGFPHVSFLGEEGSRGDLAAEFRWIVDPIDGTVNYAYAIPHACVSIALQRRVGDDAPHPDLNYETIVGVVYDPFTGEMWTARQGHPARLNGKPVRVSAHTRLADSLVTAGFARKRKNLDNMLPIISKLAYKVRKIRMMGSAALSLVYVAGGRFDAYLESGVNLWDIAAGGFILQCAGGDFFHEPLDPKNHVYRLLANNGHLRRQLQNLFDDAAC